MPDKTNVYPMEPSSIGIHRDLLDPKHASFDLFDYAFSQEIWRAKYSNNGKDATHQETFLRVAQAIAGAEPNDEKRTLWEENFYRAMEIGVFMPAGRILAGAGTANRVTLVNCFVNETVPDSMEGIMEALTNTALTMQQGGGMGTDFSTIRPKGALLRRTGSEASGPMPFMDTWDANCKTIMSAGSRRGAMMGTMICTHPDLMDFIHAKHEAQRLRMFNVSVLVTDGFMQAVHDDEMWDLHFNVPPADNPECRSFVDTEGVTQFVYATYKARDIWDAILESTYEHAEPGVIFVDRVNQMNNLQYLEYIMCTNPCGEQPLPPHGACNLGAINLARLVMNPFTEDAYVNETLLQAVIKVAVRFLDNVIDVTAYPLEQQAKEQMLKRRVGLGIAGYADMLIQMGLRYGSEEARIFTRNLAKMIARESYLASVQLAVERKPFLGFDADKFLASEYVQTALEADVQEAIRKYGIRNGVLQTIAPTGTTSIYYGNLAGGLEPNFMFEYLRKVLQNDDTWKEQKVESFISRFAAHCDIDVGDSSTGVWVSTPDLTVGAHLVTQETWQTYIDASISKTINCPQEMTYEEFQTVYYQAWEAGCKGCTTYRPSEGRGSVLSAVSDDTETDTHLEGGISAPEPMERPYALDGTTFKLRWPGLTSAIYMTVNKAQNGQPFEVFFMSKDNKSQEWMTALSLTLTSLFRLGVDATFIFKELQQIQGAGDVSWIEGRRYDSLASYIGHVLDECINGIDTGGTEVAVEGDVLPACPECGEHAVVSVGGCPTCTACGYSKCG